MGMVSVMHYYREEDANKLVYWPIDRSMRFLHSGRDVGNDDPSMKENAFLKNTVKIDYSNPQTSIFVRPPPSNVLVLTF